MNSLWDIRIFLGLVPKESPCINHKEEYVSVDPANGEGIQRNKPWEEFRRAEEEEEEEDILRKTWNGRLICYSDTELYRYWLKVYCKLTIIFYKDAARYRN